MKYVVFDIGGSSIKYALMNEKGVFLDKGKTPVPKDSLNHLFDILEEVYHQYQGVAGIGISLPGVIDPIRGYAYTSGALRYYDETEFVKLLQKRIDLPITIGNDAKCAANAEIGFGSLKNIDDGAVLVFGTGIGGCLIKDHKVITGKHFSAGEVSSIITDYHYGTDFNYAWASRNGIKGLLNRVQEALNTKENYSGEKIFEMANQGDKKILAALREFTFEISVQLMNINTWFDCEKIAIGGGISVQPLFIQLINETFDEIFEAYKKAYYPCAHPEIVLCTYGNDANLIGALYQHLTR